MTRLSEDNGGERGSGYTCRLPRSSAFAVSASCPNRLLIERRSLTGCDSNAIHRAGVGSDEGGSGRLAFGFVRSLRPPVWDCRAAKWALAAPSSTGRRIQLRKSQEFRGHQVTGELCARASTESRPPEGPHRRDGRGAGRVARGRDAPHRADGEGVATPGPVHAGGPALAPRRRAAGRGDVARGRASGRAHGASWRDGGAASGDGSAVAADAQVRGTARTRPSA